MMQYVTWDGSAEKVYFLTLLKVKKEELCQGCDAISFSLEMLSQSNTSLPGKIVVVHILAYLDF